MGIVSYLKGVNLISIWPLDYTVGAAASYIKSEKTPSTGEFAGRFGHRARSKSRFVKPAPLASKM